MNADLLHAEFDGFQVTIIVLAVIFSSVKWLWEQWQGNTETNANPPPPPDEIERQLREAAWKRQTAQTQPAPAPEKPVRRTPATTEWW